MAYKKPAMNNFEIITLKKNNITDFAKERNLLLKSAKAGWILFLDSDEKLSPELRQEILKATSTSEVEQARFRGFIVPRKNYFLGQYIGTDKILRLGRNDAGRWERKVHETWMIKGRIGELKNPIIHNTARSLHEYIGKIDWHSTLHAEANFEERKVPNLAKIILYPKLKFWQSMIIGRGVTFSILQAFHSFLSWSKLYLSRS